MTGDLASRESSVQDATAHALLAEPYNDNPNANALVHQEPRLSARKLTLAR